ncbi:MAG TPA: thiazole synthase [Candidatus Baltobacteraceae bacterium]|nr:thiazole synthase [Candidatus Baltobacteraceae bacterium]
MSNLVDTPLMIGRHALRSRLIVGTGKYSSLDVMREAHEASGTEMLTVAIRRIHLDDPSGKTLLDYLDRTRYKILPNTAGCTTAKEAILTAQLAREALETDLIKLEVIGDSRTLYPDVSETIEAARELVAQGFTVLPYIGDDPVACLRLEEIGCAAVMPLAAPIGSGLGICNPYSIAIIKERATIPVILDAGVGTASDATMAMELGVDGVLMNTGIAAARDPVAMARAMRFATEAGRLAFLAGRMAKRLYANASSPMSDLIGTTRHS